MSGVVPTVEVQDAVPTGSMEEWQSVFERRAKCAIAAEEYGMNAERCIEVLLDQGLVRKNSVSIAMMNLKNHSDAIQKSIELIRESSTNMTNCFYQASTLYERRRICLKAIEIDPVLLQGVAATLGDLVDSKDGFHARAEWEKESTKSNLQMAMMVEVIGDIANATNSLGAKAKKDILISPNHLTALVKDLNTISQKIRGDTEHVHSLPKNNAVSNVARLSVLHARDYMPELERVLQQIQNAFTQHFTSATTQASTCLSILRELSKLQSRIAQVSPQLRSMQETLQLYESLVHRVSRPVGVICFYAKVLVQANKRSTLRQSESSSQEMAENKIRQSQEEMKRYSLDGLDWSSWLGTGQQPDLLGSDLQKTLEDFVHRLQTSGLFAEALKDVNAVLFKQNQSSSPTSSQNSGIALKTSTVAEYVRNATNSPSAVQEPFWSMKSKDSLVDRRTIYEARIRKLEDLLHRRSYAPEVQRQPTSSKSSREMAEGDSAIVVNDILRLQQDLATQEQRVSVLTTTLAERIAALAELRVRHEETVGVKNDLLANLQAHGQEALAEKKLVIDEKKAVQERLEALSDVMEQEVQRGEAAHLLAQELTEELLKLQRDHKREMDEKEEESETLRSRCHNLERQREATLDIKQEQSEDKQQTALDAFTAIAGALEGSQHEADFGVYTETVNSILRQIDQIRPFPDQQRPDQLLEWRTLKARDLTQRLYTYHTRIRQLLDAISRTDEDREKQEAVPMDEVDLLYWMDGKDSDAESQLFQRYMSNITAIDLDHFTSVVQDRIASADALGKKWQREARGYRDRARRAIAEAQEKIAFHKFKEGDLALFLPTRNQQSRTWAAFNVLAPHYFLNQGGEEDGLRLAGREWLLARITKIEERVVDLSQKGKNDNPFELSDGLKWYLLTAVEEKVLLTSDPVLPRRKGRP